MCHPDTPRHAALGHSAHAGDWPHGAYHAHSFAIRLTTRMARFVVESASKSVYPAAHTRSWAALFVLRPFDLVSGLLYVSVAIVYAVTHVLRAQPFDLPQFAGLLAALGALSAIGRWEHWRYRDDAPRRVVLALFVVQAALIEIVSQIDGFGLSVYLYVILPFRAALAFGMPTGALVAGLVFAVFGGKLAWFKPQWYLAPEMINLVTVFVILNVFMLAVARLVLRERAANNDAERAAVGAAVAGERNRVAREIHDGLGHYLTAINVQLEKAVVFHERAPDVALQSARDAKRMADEALDDVRRSVGLLRDQTDIAPLPKLIEQLADAARTSVPVAVAITGTEHERGYGPQARLALYRATQEALTNARRHARASRVEIALTLSESHAELIIRDDGVGFDATTAKPGAHGLPGLRERLELVGGALALDSAPGHGATVRITIPRRFGAQHDD
jgi:signal transduction histidine kinase